MKSAHLACMIADWIIKRVKSVKEINFTTSQYLKEIHYTKSSPLLLPHTRPVPANQQGQGKGLTSNELGMCQMLL